MDEVLENYKVDLTNIYKDVFSFDNDCFKMDDLINKLEDFKDKVFSNSKELKEYLNLLEEIEKIFNKLKHVKQFDISKFRK